MKAVISAGVDVEEGDDLFEAIAPWFKLEKRADFLKKALTAAHYRRGKFGVWFVMLMYAAVVGLVFLPHTLFWMLIPGFFLLCATCCLITSQEAEAQIDEQMVEVKKTSLEIEAQKEKTEKVLSAMFGGADVYMRK